MRFGTGFADKDEFSLCCQQAFGDDYKEEQHLNVLWYLYTIGISKAKVKNCL